jgi:hypothetical protein
MLANKLAKKVLGVDLIRRIRDQGDPYQNGGWYGNDTVWRMVLDLNKVLRYGRPDGTLGAVQGRRMFTFVDGLWAGEAEGPLKPSAKEGAVFLAGGDPVLVDVVAATLMGFDYRKIKLLTRALGLRDHALTSADVNDVVLVSNEAAWRMLEGVAEHHLGFAPPRGWRGHIELEPLTPTATRQPSRTAA